MCKSLIYFSFLLVLSGVERLSLLRSAEDKQGSLSTVSVLTAETGLVRRRPGPAVHQATHINIEMQLGELYHVM